MAGNKKEKPMYGMYPPWMMPYPVAPTTPSTPTTRDPFTQMILREYFAESKERKKKESEKKKDEKKPPSISIAQLGLLFFLMAPFIGPLILTIELSGWRHVTEILATLGK